MRERVPLDPLEENLPMTAEARARYFACIRSITIQIYGRTSKEREERVRELIMKNACEHGYPIDFIDGKERPMSLSKATKKDGYIANLAVNHFADTFYTEYGYLIYLYEEDENGRYKSIGGRSREEMIRDFPEVYYEKKCG